MPGIRIVSTKSQAEKATRTILQNNGIVAASCKTGRYGAVSFVAISTVDQSVYVFDVKDGRDVIFDGGVGRILQSADVLKVMHDCSKAVASLSKQHGIFLNNVFDTQIAYSVILESEGLMARAVEMSSLCNKTSVPQYSPSDKLKKLIREDQDVWMRRPLNSDMLHTIASQVCPLLPTLYTKLLKAIRPEHQSWFQKMNAEHRESGIEPARVRSKRQARIKQEQKETAKKEPLLRLSTRQRRLLANTEPFGREL